MTADSLAVEIARVDGERRATRADAVSTDKWYTTAVRGIA